MDQKSLFGKSIDDLLRGMWYSKEGIEGEISSLKNYVREKEKKIGESNEAKEKRIRELDEERTKLISLLDNTTTGEEYKRRIEKLENGINGVYEDSKNKASERYEEEKNKLVKTYNKEKSLIEEILNFEEGATFCKKILDDYTTNINIIPNIYLSDLFFLSAKEIEGLKEKIALGKEFETEIDLLKAKKIEEYKENIIKNVPALCMYLVENNIPLLRNMPTKSNERLKKYGDAEKQMAYLKNFDENLLKNILSGEVSWQEVKERIVLLEVTTDWTRKKLKEIEGIEIEPEIKQDTLSNLRDLEKRAEYHNQLYSLFDEIKKYNSLVYTSQENIRKIDEAKKKVSERIREVRSKYLDAINSNLNARRIFENLEHYTEKYGHSGISKLSLLKLK